jgi:hypothetical protein
VPFGGGAQTGISNPLALNSSFPTDTGWAVDVNNPTASDGSFEVTVVCARRPQVYTVVEAPPVTAAAGQVTTATATCPSGTKPLAGGVFSNSSAANVDLTASFPVASQWRVAEGNDTTAATQVGAVAVCGSIRGYRVRSKPVTDVFSGLELGGVECAGAGKVAIGGGAFSTTTTLDVRLASQFPATHGWDTDVLSILPTGSGGVWQPFVICAGS